MNEIKVQSNFKRIFFQVISMVFQPVLMPTVGMILLTQTALFQLYPPLWKWLAIIGTVIFTGILPATPILIMLRKGEVKDIFISKREQRTLPYLFSILAFTFWTVFLWRILLFPNFLIAIGIGSVLSIVAVMLINFKWKISAHLSGIGGVVGGIFAVCYQLAINPVMLFVIVLLISALTAISRVELKAHTPAQTLAGFTVGFLCVFLPGILF